MHNHYHYITLYIVFLDYSTKPYYRFGRIIYILYEIYEVMYVFLYIHFCDKE